MASTQQATAVAQPNALIKVIRPSCQLQRLAATLEQMGTWRMLTQKTYL
jgi:hypothetical protein